MALFEVLEEDIQQSKSQLKEGMQKTQNRTVKEEQSVKKNLFLESINVSEMRKGKIFRNENLTLLSLAEKLNITPHQLSWVINDKMNQSFSTLINRYRIEDVKKRLADGIKDDSTILQLALDSGFSTKTAFNRAFKKFTGLTPSQYRKNKNH